MSARFWLIGNLRDRRIGHWRRALAAAGVTAGQIDYRELLCGDGALERIREGDCVRLDSPGEDLELYCLLTCHGYVDAQAEGLVTAISPEQLASMPPEPGRILSMRQWYLGLQRLLLSLDESLTPRAVRWLTPPRDVLLLFDKLRCQQRLAEAGVSVPRLLGPVRGWSDVRRVAQEQGQFRLFVKPAHGSSASGMVALRLDPDRPRVLSTAHRVCHAEELRLYNSLRIRYYRTEAEVSSLIDRLCADGCHAEAWLPKAMVGGRGFDLRILVLNGEAAQVVMRTSSTPFTNLHLGNARGDVDALRRVMGPGRWGQAMDMAEAVAREFPESMQVAVDLMLLPGLRAPTVLEANAFGDLLPGVLWRGHDSYAAQSAVIGRLLGGAAAGEESAVA